MRQSFDGLLARARLAVGRDPLAGDMFLFGTFAGLVLRRKRKRPPRGWPGRARFPAGDAGAVGQYFC